MNGSALNGKSFRSILLEQRRHIPLSCMEEAVKLFYLTSPMTSATFLLVLWLSTRRRILRRTCCTFDFSFRTGQGCRISLLCCKPKQKIEKYSVHFRKRMLLCTDRRDATKMVAVSSLDRNFNTFLLVSGRRFSIEMFIFEQRAKLGVQRGEFSLKFHFNSREYWN